MVKPGAQSGAVQEAPKFEVASAPAPTPARAPRTRTEPVEKKEKVDTTYWIKTTKEQRDEMIEFRAFLKRLSTMHRFDPEWPDNIKHGRKEPALLKKGVELMEKIL